MAVHKAVVGLGNPGKEYEMTRHNIGFMAVKKLGGELDATFKKESRFHALYAKAKFEGVDVHLLLPQTYMNESGASVLALAQFYKLKASDIIVVHDDAALPFGQMRVKPKGSPGGHNGLKSIEKHISSSYYTRLKLGIGEGKDKTLRDHVLDPFERSELEELPEFIDKAAQVIKNLLTGDIHAVMNAVNRIIRS